MPIVRLDGVAKNYGRVAALAGIDLDVEDGEFLTLLGPSGSGKTTILNIVAGMARPSAGRVFLRGRDITAVPPSQRQLGMVFQSYALMPHMTVFENIAFPLRVRRVPRPDVRRKVEEVLQLVQLPDVAERKPGQLSGGQQQRVAIARCLVYDPSLVLMDEPLGALDRKLREQMQLEIKRLHARLGVTMIYVTHDQEEALVMSDRICLMNGGRIEQLGAPSDLYFRPASVFAATFLGESNILSATVVVAHPEATVSGPLQATIRCAAPSPVPPGTALKLLVRPESIGLLAAGETADNTFDGEIREAIFVGSAMRYLVRLADGTELAVKEPSAAGGSAQSPGAAVRLGWAAASSVLLHDDAANPEGEG